MPSFRNLIAPFRSPSITSPNPDNRRSSPPPPQSGDPNSFPLNSVGTSTAPSPNLTGVERQGLRSRRTPNTADLNKGEEGKLSSDAKAFYPTRSRVRESSRRSGNVAGNGASGLTNGSSLGQDRDRTERETGFDRRGYPAIGASSRSPLVGGLSSTPKKTDTSGGRVDSRNIYPPAQPVSTHPYGALGINGDEPSSSRQSFISLAPSNTTMPNAVASSSSTYLNPNGHEPGRSRPGSMYSYQSHSPAPSFSSDAGFGAAASFGQAPLSGLQPQPVASEYARGKRHGKNNASSSSLASLDSRLTMGREVNEPGFEGLGGKFSLPVDPAQWGDLGPEADDALHDPWTHLPQRKEKGKAAAGSPVALTPFQMYFNVRAIANMGFLVLLVVALVSMFGGYPILSHYLSKSVTSGGAYNLGGINETGQIPSIGNFGLIDTDTPQSAYTWTSMETGDTWNLIFSDEFEVEGRSFYDGDDPYWEAADLHYWATNNLEWYDPRAVTTVNGSLQITLTDHKNHGLNYTGGMINTWNKFCFTGGYVEASVSLPGKSDVYGLWPAIWALGNLGRAGYGGTLDGMWPYTYNECDVGTLPNQTMGSLPQAALTDGDPSYDGALSYLPGQRLSRCTCTSDATHPGPTNSDGTWMGRGAPEIDMFEAQVDSSTLIGHVSQSSQWAPFNPWYNFINNSDTYAIYPTEGTALNGYLGGIQQQATSALTVTNQNCYTAETGCFSVYGFEYAAGDDGYVTWVSNNTKAWTIRGEAMAANSLAEVGQRGVPGEPMYLIMNLGISENFGAVDYDDLETLWPVTMLVDYIRVYQDPDAENIGCDPSTMPTQKYIDMYPSGYSDPNITTWDQMTGNAAKPKNNLVDTC